MYLEWFTLSCVYLASCAHGLEILRQDPCGNTDLHTPQGVITSPNYPQPFQQPISCEWHIHSPPNSLLTISVVDLDIGKDNTCHSYICCSDNWLALPSKTGDGSMRLCGDNITINPIIVSQSQTHIQFYASKVNKTSRGFKIKYSIDEQPCQPFDIQCFNGKCVSNSSFCNGVDDCGDHSDEKDCVHILGASKMILESMKEVMEPKPINSIESSSFCGEERTPCTFSPNHCYLPKLELCDGKFNCPKGEDEVSCDMSCPGQIKCSSGDGCYTPVQRCNSVRNCRDNSDETGCPEEPCGPLQFVCLNGACVTASALCDGNDDCGDLSDEENCTKTSLMTAAIMGLLACVFLFVVGLGCLYRLYSIRVRASAAFMQHLEPDPMDEDFIYREPPPAYSVAVHDQRVITYPTNDVTERFFENDPSPRGQRTRCPRRNRRRSRTTSSENSARARPRSSHNNSPGLSLRPADTPTSSKGNDSKMQNNVSATPHSHTSNIELSGFGFQTERVNEIVSTSSCPNDSPCSSPSLSPSRESVTSSTSLEDQDELVQT